MAELIRRHSLRSTGRASDGRVLSPGVLAAGVLAVGLLVGGCGVPKSDSGAAGPALGPGPATAGAAAPGTGSPRTTSPAMPISSGSGAPRQTDGPGQAPSDAPGQTAVPTASTRPSADIPTATATATPDPTGTPEPTGTPLFTPAPTQTSTSSGSVDPTATTTGGSTAVPAPSGNGGAASVGSLSATEIGYGNRSLRLSAPDGWVRTTPLLTSQRNRTQWTEPDGTVLVLVEINDASGTDPLTIARWHDAERQSSGNGGYVQGSGRVTPGPGNGATWEYSYRDNSGVRLQALDWFAPVGSTDVALFVSAPPGNQTAARALWVRMIDSTAAGKSG